MAFQSQFVLTRAYLEESFDESQPFSPQQQPRWLLLLAMPILGLAALNFTDLPALAPSILIGLGVLEGCSFYFRRSWWLTRQMFSRSANCEISLRIDEHGVTSNSPFNELTLLWSELKPIINTPKGIILVHQSGAQNYLSKTVLSDDALDFIHAQLNTPASAN